MVSDDPNEAVVSGVRRSRCGQTNAGNAVGACGAEVRRRMWDEELCRLTGYRAEDVESMLKYLCRYCKLNLCSK